MTSVGAESRELVDSGGILLGQAGLGVAWSATFFTHRMESSTAVHRE